MVLDAIQIVLSIFIMIGVGMFMTYKGWLDDKGTALLSTIVIKIAVPGMIISKLFASYTRADLLGSYLGLIIPLISMLATYFIGSILARMIKLPPSRRGLFSVMFAFSNTVFIGVPIGTALFGDGVIPYTLLYYIINTLLFWTLGVSGLKSDGGQKGGGLKAGLLRLKTVPLITFSIVIILIMVGFYPPKFIMDSSKYIGNMVTPLASIFMGSVLYKMLKKGFRWEKGYTLIIIGRFIISPLFAILLTSATSQNTLLNNALIVQAAMPVMTNSAITAAAFGADEEYATGGIALTTLLSMVFIPLLMYILPLVTG